MWLPREKESQAGKDWEFGISKCKLLYVRWVNNKVLFHSTGMYIQSPVINHNGKEKIKVYLVKKKKERERERDLTELLSPSTMLKYKNSVTQKMVPHLRTCQHP